MSVFSVDALTILSETEGSARRIPFHRRSTVLLGENETGKSGIVKSIYATLGAEVRKSAPTWKSLNVVTVLDFRIDDVAYSMIRFGSSFGLFGSDGRLRTSYQSVTRELSPALGAMLEFALELRETESDETRLATPAFMFLPYYVDQDDGWKDAWNSFARLGQFRAWKPDVASYYTGILPDAYYRAMGQLRTRQSETEVAATELRALERLYESRAERWKDAPVTLDPLMFEKELARLEKKAETLRRSQDRLRKRAVDVTSHITGLDAQIQIMQRVTAELGLDYETAVTLAESVLTCPTCSATYSNDAADRFMIAADQGQSSELVAELRSERTRAEEQRAELQSKIQALSEEYASIEEIMSVQQGDVVFRDVIRSAGRDEFKRSLTDEIEIAAAARAKCLGAQDKAQTEVDKYKRPDRRKAVLDFMRQRLDHFYARLAVHAVQASSLKKVEVPPSSTGSEGVRALLAYFFAVLHAAREFGGGRRMPVVIDSPNQQAQDDLKLDKILRFVFDELPAGSQLILATERLPEEPSGDWALITLDRPHRMLREEEYAAAHERVGKLRDQVLSDIERKRSEEEDA